MFTGSVKTTVLALAVGSLSAVNAFDLTHYDNVAVYWGQNSYGAVNPNDKANWQKTLSYYCQDDAIDMIPIAFVDTFWGTGGEPSLNLASTCNPTDNATFPGTGLANCSVLASDIEFCQSKGKVLTISLGGAGGSVGFTNDTQAQAFAQQIWNLFLGGSSPIRPFGSAVLDGVDLDVEGGPSTGYAAFVTEIRALAAGASKPYYVTAAPQCVYPDAILGSVINAVGFDAIYVQFYNNWCGLPNYATLSDWNYGTWDVWAKTVSPNPNVKVFLAAPGASQAAGSGYVDLATLSNIATTMRKDFPSFGGVALWDASQAYFNNRYDLGIKNALTAAGGTGYQYLPCTAPAWVSGNSYPTGSQVTYDGYIWESAYWIAVTPSINGNTGWAVISACGGPPVLPPSSTTTTTVKTTTTTTTVAVSTTTTVKTTTTTTTTTTPITTTTTASTHTTTTTPPPTTTTTTATKTSTSSVSTPTGGNCANVAAWVSTVAYVGGTQVTYGGHLWTAKWWSEADVPGGAAGDWADDGPCTSSSRRSRFWPS